MRKLSFGKKIVAIVAAACLSVTCFGLAGCGATSGSSSSAGSESSEVSPSGEDAQDNSAPQGSNAAQGIKATQSGEAAQNSEAQGSGEAADGEEQAADGEQQQTYEEVQAAYEEALRGKGLVSSFVSENVTDATVTSEAEAQRVIGTLIDKMGGDDTTEMDLVNAIPTENGTTYYIFRQEAGEVLVHGASAKIIVNKDGKVTGLVSAILPDVKVTPATRDGLSQEQAEQLVAEELANQGMPDAEILSEFTTLTIVPLPNDQSRYCLAWVVYIDAPAGERHDMAYLANYVSAEGDYMYNTPVSEPNNVEALTGQTIDFDFDAFDQKELSFDITKDDTTREVTVPVLLDKQSGEIAYLGDAERKILCVDFSELAENDRLACPVAEDGESIDACDLGVYENFIRIYDFFSSIGWRGPNDLGTPVLLMMNYKENGEPADNCIYAGYRNGWESFAFGRVRDYGAATDVVAHEFTHCITGTTMTTNLYVNEPGAINEGMSDIMGNLVEMLIDGDDGAWLMGEKAMEGGFRSMSDPTSHIQPEYRWGIYYTPDAPEGTEVNDQGGVHTNSSLLNIVSYKLNEAGMAPNDQVYFWTNVALAMVPTTDYVQMAELLPWVLEQSSLGQYTDALKKAIDEAGYTNLEQPSELPENAGAVEFKYPDADSADQGFVCITFYEKENLDAFTPMTTWPTGENDLVSATLPEGDYYVRAVIGPSFSEASVKAYSDDGWIDFDVNTDDITEKSALVHVDKGQVIELPTNGLG
ncbi:MAG: M4 family metallopeptidase [Eggerthellaceae bacterium]|nr:M4 family metallopeptidase [Eggerthellaceae bacterium]